MAGNSSIALCGFCKTQKETKLFLLRLLTSAATDNKVNIAETAAGFTIIGHSSEANGTIYVVDNANAPFTYATIGGLKKESIAGAGVAGTDVTITTATPDNMGRR